jgi:dihydroorotate dehydrogenase electron transfer subunit
MTAAPFSKVSAIKPGQFVHLKIPQCRIYFRRAFSVYDINREEKSIDIIFKVFGRGTSAMARMKKGDRVDILGPLGNGFTLPRKTEWAIMIAGGIGMPPIYLLARRLLERKHRSDRMVFFYGANTKSELADIGRVRRLGIKVIATTVDGSAGARGMVTVAVTDWLQSHQGQKKIFACGPEGMLQAIDSLALERKIHGQLSLEAPMPCGVGICLGCVRPLRSGGYTRVCRDGPVYDIGEVKL